MWWQAQWIASCFLWRWMLPDQERHPIYQWELLGTGAVWWWSSRIYMCRWAGDVSSSTRRWCHCCGWTSLLNETGSPSNGRRMNMWRAAGDVTVVIQHHFLFKGGWWYKKSKLQTLTFGSRRHTVHDSNSTCFQHGCLKYVCDMCSKKCGSGPAVQPWIPWTLKHINQCFHQLMLLWSNWRKLSWGWQVSQNAYHKD